MVSDVYIFGYLSILAEDSLATSIGGRGGAADVPARLHGHVRDWSAARDFADNPRKRYVHAADWRPAGRVAFANLRPLSGGVVNGICRRVPADRLDELDFREQGYRRVELGEALAPYPGFVLESGLPRQAYIDPEPDPLPAPVSRAYLDMGRRGAETIDARVPGFAADYRASTPPPLEVAEDLAFVFISGDGRHLWLLDESDASLVLLLRFATPQFSARANRVPERARPVTAGLEWLDLRRRGTKLGAHPRVPAALAAELLAPADPARLAASPFWLCRLAATQDETATDPLLANLAADPDPWVRRAAQFRRGTPT